MRDGSPRANRAHRLSRHNAEKTSRTQWPHGIVRMLTRLLTTRRNSLIVLKQMFIKSRFDVPSSSDRRNALVWACDGGVWNSTCILKHRRKNLFQCCATPPLVDRDEKMEAKKRKDGITTNYIGSSRNEAATVGLRKSTTVTWILEKWLIREVIKNTRNPTRKNECHPPTSHSKWVKGDKMTTIQTETRAPPFYHHSSSSFPSFLTALEYPP